MHPWTDDYAPLFAFVVAQTAVIAIFILHTEISDG